MEKYRVTLTPDERHALEKRSYRIPGSWHVRMSYTEDISVPNP